MTSPNNIELFICPTDLYRLGNSQSPRLDNVRPQDVDTYDRNGITMIRANNKGISLRTWDDLQRMRMAGWVWKLPKGITLPQGLNLFNDHGGHYMLIPLQDMPVDQFRGLLSQLALCCEKVAK
jgi:hypothetical protein